MANFCLGGEYLLPTKFFTGGFFTDGVLVSFYVPWGYGAVLGFLVFPGAMGGGGGGIGPSRAGGGGGVLVGCVQTRVLGAHASPFELYSAAKLQ